MSKFIPEIELPIEIGKDDVVKELEKSDNCYCKKDTNTNTVTDKKT